MPSPKEKPKGAKTKKSAGKVAARAQPAISAKQAAKLLKDKYVQQLDQHSRKARASRSRPSIRWRGPGAGPWTSF